MNQTNLTDVSQCQLMIHEESFAACNNSNCYNGNNDSIQIIQSMQLNNFQEGNQIPIDQENNQNPVQPKKPFSQIMVQFNILHFKRKLLSYIHPQKELTKQQFSYIADKSSSFKTYPKKYTQKISIFQQSKVVSGFYSFYNEFCNNLRLKVKKCLQNTFNSIPIIDPHSTKKLIWDGIITLMRMYLLIWIPILITFKNSALEDFNAFTLNICSSMFVIDLMLQTFTIKFDKGLPVKDRSQLFMYQVNWWTAIELFSFVISLYFSIQFHQNNFSMSVVEDQGWSKIFLLLLIIQTKNILSFIENVQYVLKPNKTTSSVIDLLKLICLIFLLQHIFACIWIIIGTYQRQRNIISWLDQTKLEEDSTWNVVYLEGLYFISVTTFTVGYGDITPQNRFEKAFVIVYMFFCTLQLSYSVNAVGSILIQLKENNEEINQKMTSVTEFMRNRQISRGLQFKVREYLNYYWHEENVLKKNESMEIIKLLPDELQKNLQQEGAFNILNKCQFIREKFSQGFITQLAEISYVQNYFPGDKITQMQNIYVIEIGSVEVIQNQTVIGELQQFQSFGLRRIELNYLHETKYRAKSFANLLVIPYSSLVQLVAQNQNELEIVSLSTFSLDNQCLICHGEHLSEICNQVHYLPDKEKVIKKHLYNCTQTRRKVKRKSMFSLTQNRKNFKNCQEQADQFQQDWNVEIDSLFPNNNDKQIQIVCTPRSEEINEEKPKLMNIHNFLKKNQEQKSGRKDNPSENRIEVKDDTFDLNKQLESIQARIQNLQATNDNIPSDVYFLYKKLQFLLGLNDCQIDKVKSYKFFYKSWNADRIIINYNFVQNASNGGRIDKGNLKQISKYLLFPKIYFLKYHAQQQKQNNFNSQTTAELRNLRTQKRKKRIAINPVL